MITYLKDGDSVARYCPSSSISEDGRISPAAFHLRKNKNEKDLSVYWLEYYGKDSEAINVNFVMNDLPLIPAKSAFMGIVGVGEARIRVERELDISLEFKHTPNGAPSHTSILGMDCDDHDSIATELAEIANDRKRYPFETFQRR